jgi:hypothetical protein
MPGAGAGQYVALGVNIIRWHERFGFGIQGYHFLTYLRICAQQLGVLQARR